MTFRQCIDDALARGDISADAASRARRAYDGVYEGANGSFGPVEGDRLAADAALSQLEAAADEADRLRAMMIRSRAAILDGIERLKASRGGGGGEPPGRDGLAGGRTPRGYDAAQFARGLELLIENKPGISGAPFASVEGRYRALRGEADAMMAGLIEAFETRTGLDAPNRATLTNVVREAFGQPTRDTGAKALALAWAETAEHLRLLFNAAGGSIGKIADWGLPQAHDAYAVRAAGREAWVATVMPRLARDRMRSTEGQPLSDGQLLEALNEVWENIASLGATVRAPGEGLGRGALANRYRDSRFLIFKSADDWMAYQQAFGDGDAFGVMMGHIDEMARDIAQMQILGPNPERQWAWLKSAALREALIEEGAGKRGAADRAKGYVQTADNMLDFFTGSLSTPTNSRLASWGVSTRAYLTSVALGSAILSDVPTAPVFGAFARNFSGVGLVGDFGRFAALLSPTGVDIRATARRAGFINEQATDGLIRATQDNLRLLTVGERMDGGLNAFARRLPSAVLRMQGLTGYTAARKRAFRFEFMGALHDRKGRDLASLQSGDAEDRALAGFLTSRGFTAKDWDVVRAAPTWEPETGAAFLRPMDVPDRELALRLGEAIELETRFAVPETTLWTRAKLIGESRPGTVVGEARRSWAMFRSFTLTSAHLYAEEIALRGQRLGLSPFMSSAVGLGGLFVFLTLTGGLTVQLRALASGKDPRQMDDPKFWAEAALTGGGLWMVGDFIFAAEQRTDGQLDSFGPVGAAAGDAYDGSIGNVVDVSSGIVDGQSPQEAVDNAHLGRDASGALRRYVPGSNVWWLRAMWNRSVVDQVQRMLDPEADAEFRRQQERLEREYDQGQWWPAGSAAPQRAPSVDRYQ